MEKMVLQRTDWWAEGLLVCGENCSVTRGLGMVSPAKEAQHFKEMVEAI